MSLVSGLSLMAILCLFLAVGIAGRLKTNAQTGVFLQIFFAWLVLFLLSGMIMMMVGPVIGGIDRYLNAPRYEAVIIDVESSVSAVPISSDIDERRTRNVRMFRPTYQFTDSSGQVITHVSNTTSGERSIVGQRITIAYENGGLVEITKASLVTAIGFMLMLALMVYIVVYAILFACGVRMDGLKRVGILSAFAFVMPAMMGWMLWEWGLIVYGGLFLGTGFTGWMLYVSIVLLCLLLPVFLLYLRWSLRTLFTARVKRW